MGERRVFYSVSGDILKTIRDRNPKVEFETTPDVFGGKLTKIIHIESVLSPVDGSQWESTRYLSDNW